MFELSNFWYNDRIETFFEQMLFNEFTDLGWELDRIIRTCGFGQLWVRMSKYVTIRRKFWKFRNIRILIQVSK